VLPLVLLRAALAAGLLVLAFQLWVLMRYRNRK